MTLLHADGFEGKDPTLIYEVTNIFSTTYPTDTRFARGNAWHGGGSSGRYVQKSVTASATIIVGHARRHATAVATEMVSLWGDAGVTQHLTIMSNASSGIEVRRGTTGGTLLASSATGIIPTNFAWFYLEIKATIADSGGTVEVRMNGNSTPIITFTGDTKNAGTNTTVDAVRVSTHNANYSIDDLYICNGLGSVNNDFLGDVEVPTISVSAAGSTTGLTPSTGSNFQCVDELPISATDYCGSPTVGTKDTYTIQDLATSGGAIKALRMVTGMHKSDAGAASMKAALRISSTHYYGATRALGTSLTEYADIWETSPATSSAWTVSEVNAIEAGAEVA